jgi:hypothetical protein
MRRCVTPVVVLVLAAVAAVASIPLATDRAVAQQVPAAPVDDLIQLNKVARDAYAKGRAQLLVAADPVFVVAFDELVLHNGGQTLKATFTPEIYHRLKQVAHLPLGIYGALAPTMAGLDAAGDWRDSLKAMAAAADAAGDDIDRLGLAAPVRARQHRILDTARALIAGALAGAAPPTPEALTAFARQVAPWTLVNATEAANAQLDGLHLLVTAWRAQIGEAAWARAYVLVLGPRTPRAGNLGYEYFSAAMGPGAAGDRLIYTESIYDEATAMKLLGVLLIDRKVGEAFFGEPARMERDLLSDAAAAWILRTFGKLGKD